MIRDDSPGCDWPDGDIQIEPAPAQQSKVTDAPRSAPPLPGERRPILTCMASVKPEKVRWLWPGRIPLGRLTLIVGRPGDGKSYLTMALAAHVTTGLRWPDQCHCPHGTVIACNAEDDPGDTIRPRLDACGADPSRVYILSGVQYFNHQGDPEERSFTLADMPSLELALEQHPGCQLVTIDPVGSYLGGDTNSNKDNEVRAVLSPLAALARKHEVAVVLVMHNRKSGGDCADDTALGSRGFTGIARAVWHVSRDPDDKERRLFLPGKNNLGKEGDGLAFRIEGDPAAVVWENGPVQMTADEAMHALARKAAEARRPGPKSNKQDKAADWLEEELANGPMTPAELREAAVEAGHAWRTIERASTDLGIIKDRTGFAGGTQWRLPDADPVPEVQPHQDEAQSRQGEQAESHPEPPTHVDLGGNGGSLEIKAEIEESELGGNDPAKLPDTVAAEVKPRPKRARKTPRKVAAKLKPANGRLFENPAEELPD